MVNLAVVAELRGNISPALWSEMGLFRDKSHAHPSTPFFLGGGSACSFPLYTLMAAIPAASPNLMAGMATLRVPITLF